MTPAAIAGLPAVGTIEMEGSMAETSTGTGFVLAVRGAVVDVAFDTPPLPKLDEALVVGWDGPGPLIVEVQAHLDERTSTSPAASATTDRRCPPT